MKKKLSLLEISKMNRNDVKEYCTKYKINFTSKDSTKTLQGRIRKFLGLTNTTKKTTKKTIKKKQNKKVANDIISFKKVGNTVIVILPDNIKKTRTVKNINESNKLKDLVTKYNKNKYKTTYKSIIDFFDKKEKVLKKNIKKIEHKSHTLASLIDKVSNTKLKKQMQAELEKESKKVEKPKLQEKSRSTRRGEH